MKNRIIKLHGQGSKQRTVPISKPLYEYLVSRARGEGYVITGSRGDPQAVQSLRRSGRVEEFYIPQFAGYLCFLVSAERYKFESDPGTARP